MSDTAKNMDMQHVVPGEPLPCTVLTAGLLVMLLGAPLHAAPTAPATNTTRTTYADANHVGHVILERAETGAILGTPPHRYSPYGVLCRIGDRLWRDRLIAAQRICRLKPVGGPAWASHAA